MVNVSQLKRIALVVAALFVLTLTACAPEPTVITRERAIQVLVQEIIKPESLEHDAMALMTPETLNKGDEVRPLFGEDRVYLMDAPTWFAYIDDNPLADFVHPTRFVFIDATTGEYRVTNEEWWPVLNGVSLFRSDRELSDENLIVFATLRWKK